jgi:hexosaminidase
MMKRRIVFGSIAAVAVLSAIAAGVILPRLGGVESTPSSVSVIPQPVQLRLLPGEPFTLPAGPTISADPALAPVGDYLAESISASTHDIVNFAVGGSGAAIALELDPALADEAYALRATEDGIRISAGASVGAFWAVQTLRQLLSPAAPWTVPAVDIEDSPRFTYRGAMLDVARHFFSVGDVKRYIDDIALLKINHLHLHLTDDQGWRLEIESRPLLTEVGGRTAVGTGEGGYYTQDDYRELVAYAASRFVTIVPEIDVPGHTNAALASYGELNPDGEPANPYTGVEVGFSSLDANSEVTYDFLDDVFREVAELTPGPYLHIGGDESRATSDEDFETFVARAAAIAESHGKTVIGWHEMGQSTALPAGTIGQYWNYTEPETPATAEHALSFVDQGGKLIMSPANVAYLDMKYDDATIQGLTWAQGFTDVEEAYSWDPAEVLPEVGDEQLLGVEAPLWSETLETIDEIEFMAFPRLAAIAELAWSPRESHDVDDFLDRLPAFGAYLDALDIRYNRSAGIPWLTLEP